MVLSNAERQARYRDRQRTTIEDLLVGVRRNLREWKRSIALFQEGYMRIHHNNVDASPEHVAMLQRMISDNVALLERHDPEDLTDDGNIEIGPGAARIQSQFGRGQPVAYALNEDGLAIEIRPYANESSARADAAQSPGRIFGWIGEDRWSITNIEPGS